MVLYIFDASKINSKKFCWCTPLDFEFEVRVFNVHIYSYSTNNEAVCLRKLSTAKSIENKVRNQDTLFMLTLIHIHTCTHQTALHSSSIRLNIHSIFFFLQWFNARVDCCEICIRVTGMNKRYVFSWYCFGRRNAKSRWKSNVCAKAVRLSMLQSKCVCVCVCEKLFIVTTRSIVDWIRNWMSLLNSPAGLFYLHRCVEALRMKHLYGVYLCHVNHFIWLDRQTQLHIVKSFHPFASMQNSVQCK